jgi:predicted alpha/beta superfamily hydrolase
VEFDLLQGEGFIPKNVIIIGLPNTEKNGVNMRNRDFTPTSTSNLTGGAEKFLSFFRDELMPYVINKYNAKSKGHTLYGGSLGGLFVVYAFLNEPDLFTSYIAIDPSLWWDKFYLNKIATRKFDSLASFNNTLFIAAREGNNYRYMGIAEMDSILQSKVPAGLDWKCIKYSDEQTSKDFGMVSSFRMGYSMLQPEDI